jgi:hypothetical protein
MLPCKLFWIKKKYLHFYELLITKQKVKEKNLFHAESERCHKSKTGALKGHQCVGVCKE